MNTEKLCSFLNNLGVESVENDPLLDFVIAQTEETIRNLTNLTEIPEGLEQCVIFRGAGLYLRLKKDGGLLAMEGLELSPPEKQIQEGDTSVTFAVDAALSPEQRLDQLISFLLNAGKDQIARYRRLVW